MARADLTYGREYPGQRYIPQIPQGTPYEPEALLGPELYAQGGGRVMAELARAGQLGHYAIQQQAIADATLQTTQQSYLGMPGAPNLPQVGQSSVLPPGFQDPLTGAFKLPDGMRAQLRRMRADPDLLEQIVTRNLHERAGGDYQQRLLYGQGIAGAGDKTLQGAKEELFSKVARAIEADPASKDRILGAAFSGPNANALLAEYDTAMAKQAHGGILSQLLGKGQEAAKVGTTAFGQMTSGLGGLGDIVRDAVGALTGSRHEDGTPITRADVAGQVAELPKDFLNLFGLGAPGLVSKQFRSTSAPGSTQIQRTMRTKGKGDEVASIVLPLLGLSRAADQIPGPVGDVAAEIFGMGNDIATDPTTYLTIGGGGMGKAATTAAGNIAGRARFLQHLGLEDWLPRLGRVDQFTWEQFLKSPELAEVAGPQRIAEASDVARAFNLSAQSAHGAQGWAGYSAELQKVGLNADELIPRGLVSAGPDAKLAQHLQAARGGVGLRGGVYVPFTKGRAQARFAFNVASGKGGFGPRLGTFFQRDGNRFHQLVSPTLSKIGEVFHYGSGGDQRWVAENRGLFNYTMEAATLGKGVEHNYRVLEDEAKDIERRLKPYLKTLDQATNTENNKRLIDTIEKGERSPYWTLVEPKYRDLGQRLAELKDLGRSMGLEDDVDIPMLREISDPDKLGMMERHFPHPVQQDFAQRIGYTAPSQVGAANPRTVRAGTHITGPQGTSEMLTEGSWAEIEDVTTRILGQSILSENNAAKIVQGYLASIGKAAGLTRTYRHLSEAGAIVPDVWDVAPGMVRGAGDPVRGIWSQPQDAARRAVEAAHAALGKTSEAVQTALGANAKAKAAEAQVKAELAMYASREADADSKISALTKTRAEREDMLAVARADHAQTKAEAARLHDATRRTMIDQVRTELGQTKQGREAGRRMLKDLDRRHAAAMADADRALKAQTEVLTVTPQELGRALRADMERLGAESVAGKRPLNEVRAELNATKHRLAQVEGGELAAGRRGRLMRRAAETVKAKREPIVARQRAAAAEAANLNDQIADADQAVKAAVKASDPAAEAVAQTRLTSLMAWRAEQLQIAEQATAEAAELWQLLDAGEAAGRFADLREAEVLAHQAGTTFETQRTKMSEHLRGRLTAMLELHANDLVAEHHAILENAPKLKFLNRAMREYSIIDTSVAAMPKLPPGSALADYAQEFQARVEQRGGEQLDAWVAASGGDSVAALEASIAEYTRQQSALLARELDLTSQLEAARALDPQSQALSGHQVQGDELNLFNAELHRNDQELEWWMQNRDEIRKTQTLKSISLGLMARESEELGRVVSAAQHLLQTDQRAASQAMEAALAHPRVFELLKPQIEHMAAIIGKRPFTEGGTAIPEEMSRVLDRLMTAGPDSHNAFMKVMGAINGRWKRLALSTPGSVVRRWIGNTYNAIVLAGVRPESFNTAMDALGLAKEVKTLDKIADPKLRRYLELAAEYNIFEGQFHSLGSDVYRFKQGTKNPMRAWSDGLQWRAIRGEDIARLAQFIDGLDAGMGPQAARMWTGKYHFFNNELTQAERTMLRPLYPFYAYLRNNYALQFYTLFHQPGKIALYGTLMRDLSAQPEGSTEPTWLTQSGGFPITPDTYLQNSLLDTSPLGLPQTVLGIAARGAESGWNPTDLFRGEAVSSLTPAIRTAITVTQGTDPTSGEKLYPQDLGPAAQPIAGALQALGLVNDAKQWNPRALAAFQNLMPIGSRVARGAGGLTAAQGENRLTWAFGQLLGPNVTAQGERQERSALGRRGKVVDDLLASLRDQGVDIPSTADLTKEERLALVLQQLGVGR